MKLDEKAVSRSQQRFFGMVRQAQKTGQAASPEVAQVAADISKKDAKDFASTKHKGLPEKKKLKEEDTYSQKDKEIKKTKKPRDQRYKTLHTSTNVKGNIDVNEDIIDEGSSIIQGRKSSKKSSYRGPTGDHKRDEHGHIVASHYNKTKTEYPVASSKKGKKKKGPIDWQKTKKKGYKKKSKEPKQKLPWKPKTPEERKAILRKFDNYKKTKAGALTNKLLSRYKNVKEEKSFDDFRLTLKTHKEINPKIWTDKKLDPEIATNLVKIGKEWAKFAEIPENVIKDYIIVGGNANFNYTKYSDIDLHLVVDKKKLGCEGCLDDFLRAKKQLWALTHNITIKGHPVELYAQDVDETVGSKGQYSLKQKKWTHEPTPYKLNRKDPEVIKKVKDLIYQIDSLIDAKSDDKVVFQNLKDKIGTMRKAAIQRAGEYAPENLVFKELRNRGYVEKVWNYLRDLGDKELSVEETQIDEAERHWSKGYDSGDKTVPRRKALDRAEYFDNRGENERANKIRRIAISKDHGETHEARRKAKNIKISDKIGKLRPASIDDKRGAGCGDVQKKLKEELEETTWSAMILLPSNKRRKVTFTAPSMSRKDALQIVKALYGATDVTQLNRLKYRRFKRVNEDTTIDEIYRTFTTKERKKMEDSEKERKEKNLRMKYGKNWKKIVTMKNKDKKPLRPGEVKRLVRGKWVSNKD